MSITTEDKNNLVGYIRLNNLSKEFGPVIAVDEVNIDVRKGEFVTFLGPSGSGKTTTLLMIAGFEEPTNGDILIDGETIVGKPPYKRDIGMVFQNYALFPHMTVFDNIAFPMKMRKVDQAKIKESVEETLELVRLAGYAGRYPNQLSGGQQQRIAMARAIVFNPSLLLMDEPLGALDRKLREELQLELRRLHQLLNITVIYVTHDQEEALVMSDRIAVMNHGRLEQIGSPEDLYERPTNKFVADFIGESVFLVGEISDLLDDQQYCVVKTNSGLSITASLLEKMERGSEVHIAIRPARIAILRAHEDMTNTFEGVVEELIYLGETTKYRISFGDGESLTLKQTNRFGELNLLRGEKVRVGWKADDAKVLV